MSIAFDTPVLGLFGVNMGPCATAGGAVGVAELAEGLGFDSVWAAEHVVLPRPRTQGAPLAPEYPILDPLTTLALLAGRTARITLATGIVILPQRNPVVLAKELASLDVVSGGRLLFGAGVGYVEPEMRAVGVPMAGRGARADEYLQAMRTLWADPEPAFAGRHVTVDGVDARPRPVRGTVPVAIGGHSPAAHRRAIAHGDGWYGFSLDRAATAAQLTALRRTADAAGRDLDGFDITVSPAEPLTPEVVRDYAALGVTRLALLPPRALWRPGFPLDDLLEFVRAHAPDRVGCRPYEP